MPCSDPRHQHEAWPTSGKHTLYIESCETRCGWCSKSAKTANALRAHANRHVKNLREASLNHIKIAKSKPGRRRVATCSKLAETNGLDEMEGQIVDDDDDDDDDDDTEHVPIPESYDGKARLLEVTLKQWLNGISTYGNDISDAASRAQDIRQKFANLDKCMTRDGKRLDYFSVFLHLSVDTAEGDQSFLDTAECDEFLRKMIRAQTTMAGLVKSYTNLFDDLQQMAHRLDFALWGYGDSDTHSAHLSPSSRHQHSSSEPDSNINAEERFRSQMDDIRSENLYPHEYTPRHAIPSSSASEQPSNVHHNVIDLQPPTQDENTLEHPEARTEKPIDVSLRPTMCLNCCSISIGDRTDLLNHFEWHEFVPPGWRCWAIGQGFFSTSAEKTRSSYGYNIRDVDAYLYPDFSGITIWREQICRILSRRGYRWWETPTGAELKESGEAQGMKKFNW